jgi:hypothetical protein
MMVVILSLFLRSSFGSMSMIVMEPKGAHKERKEKKWIEDESHNRVLNSYFYMAVG